LQVKRLLKIADEEQASLQLEVLVQNYLMALCWMGQSPLIQPLWPLWNPLVMEHASG
jgi:hypothetical protein